MSQMWKPKNMVTRIPMKAASVSPNRMANIDVEIRRERRIEEQQEEILVVSETHAVVDPRAVVVHLENAHAAHSAVVTAVWLELGAPFALPAVARLLRLLHQVIHSTSAPVLWHILPLWVLLFAGDCARVHENALHVAQEQEKRDRVEDHYLYKRALVRVRVQVQRVTMKPHVDEPETSDVGV
eukprot:CAMPEP_0115346528 /NCGR_PEP_ID=MMETSP0270-20121206/94393_1 /TAXON_ID=71861 /ORGANISM="Scrippsiella trochoidea, Strain CCMP3099" /LENGTH=182 /DNA_ID=CAMNT_0002768385 /DNA_START=69 /DNA_END=617 /DNA_ORIENTATION=-